MVTPRIFEYLLRAAANVHRTFINLPGVLGGCLKDRSIS